MQISGRKLLIGFLVFLILIIVLELSYLAYVSFKPVNISNPASQTNIVIQQKKLEVEVKSDISNIKLEIVDRNKFISELQKLNFVQKDAITSWKSDQKITTQKLIIHLTDKVQEFGQYKDTDKVVYESLG